MPENEQQAVPEVGTQAPVESAREQFERERLTRRQALRKFGITAGMATFAMFSVDDLARMVGKAMQQRAGDNKVAGQIAKEFQQAGIALAADLYTYGCYPNNDCTLCGGSARTGDCCSGSDDQTACCQKSYGGLLNGNVTACQQCCSHAYGATQPGGMYYDMQLRDCNNQCGAIA